MRELEAAVNELRVQLSSAQRTITEVEDRAKAELMAAMEQTRQAVLDGERMTSQQCQLKETAEAEAARLMSLLAASEQSLRQREQIRLPRRLVWPISVGRAARE